MQNEDHSAAQVQSPSEATPIPPVPVMGSVVEAKFASPRQNILDYILLILGVVAIGSFLFNVGFALTFTVLAFFIVGIVAIIRSLTSKKTYVQNQNGEFRAVKVKRETSLVAKLGITLLILAAIPVLGFMLLIALLIIMLSVGGGPSS